MKKIFTTFSLIIAFFFAASGQTLVTTNTLNKNVVLEDYTGIHCQYCPEGHVIAQAILNNNPGRAAVISVHQGSYAVPSGSEPDYRTPFGDPLAAQTGLSGYPSGTVNRHVFMGGITALGRGDWTNSSNIILGQVSPVNVGITSGFDSLTRELTVHVELYYTGNSATTTNYINVALIQDHIFGPQTGGGAGNNYEHMHMLRYLITGQWGDAVTTTTTGSLVEKTYTYTVPADYNSIPCIVSKCQVVAFVTESHQEILSGDVVDAIGGTNLYVGDITTSDSTMALGHPATSTVFSLQANSNLTGSEPFIVKLVSNAPSDWSAHLTVDANPYPDSVAMNLVKGTAKDFELEVIPGDTSGFYSYTLEMRSVNNPNAPTKYFTVYVLSNVNTLLVNAAGDGIAKQHQAVYVNGLLAAGSTYNAVMASDLFVRASHAAILTEVKDIFYNVSWTFPAFTDPEATALKAFINGGGDVLVAGQDIGWDIMSGQSGSHGTTATQDLYTNYLEAQWIDDGSTANNKMVANVSDSVFGMVATSNVVDVFGGYMYPDQIAPLADATTTFYYNTALSKISAIRTVKNGAKICYFGFGLEMIQTTAVANDVINRAWHWFMDYAVGVNENSSKGNVTLSQNMPNPAADQTVISFSLPASDRISLDLYDVNGRMISHISDGVYPAGTSNVTVSISGFNAGVYYYTLQSSTGKLTRKMIVVK
ncbi:MAG: Omp28-related outer membrane protein [Bacteroidetes bacterium]|nr:Omp28-related outer membrane protein [Bacteroidota bacterium]